ncbi:stage II sporulation protein P [Caldicellulosiruptor naganoensis]|uniref:Stage II sporulation protein P n=1 Tax=Caldicellulosiruptor naganoensis TaxID=29324 RepID=A0ABY7BHT5_9FIRM|nr:stage II sporulation protein P [Caldicellulosiruptor naganoensis]WAM32382.1 stage II sporulation protein P [Caldicellulosiruptor naganoensis]
MVKVIDLKRFGCVVMIGVLIVVELLVNRFVFSNKSVISLCFQYSKELISFNAPFLANKGNLNNLLKIENLIRFFHPIFATYCVQTLEEQNLYEDNAVVIIYDQKKEHYDSESKQDQIYENIEFQKYLNNIQSNSSFFYNIEIMNQTGYKIDIAMALSTKFKIYNGKRPSILIYHTHTTESYENHSKKFVYTSGTSDRTLDFNYNVVRVGEELKRILERSMDTRCITAKI